MKTTTLSSVLDGLKESLHLDANPKNGDVWLSPTQIAKDLGLHINTIYKIIQSGELRVHNLSVDGCRNYYRIKKEDLDDYLERRYCRW